MDLGPHDIAFIGCGSVGRPLGKLLAKAGFSIRAIACRSRTSAEAACRYVGAGVPADAAGAAASASTIIIATPDRAIAAADKAASGSVGPGRVVLHLSGALPSTLLSASRAAGAAVGSMHPLQSFTDPDEALDLVKGVVFACEGGEEAVTRAARIASALGGRPIEIPTKAKPLYHAAAAAASNFLAAILTFSVDLMEKTGMDRKTALEALTPLIEGTLRNARTQGLPAALTGPIARGDGNTVKIHLEAIRRLDPAFEEKYAALAGMTIEAALRKGSIGKETAAALRKKLTAEDAEDATAEDATGS